MAEKIEKETVSQKLNVVLEKNKKIVIGLFVLIIAAVAIFVVAEVIGDKAKEKNLSAVEVITYEFTKDSSDLEDAEVTARIEDALTKVEKYTKKSGIVGVRANMLAADLAYQNEDYEAAIGYWDAAAKKGKKSYTAPLAYFNKGVCYEELGNADEAAASYKAAADVEDFIMKSHAKFSYGRVLETKGDYKGAVEVYQELNESVPDETWAKLAKTRIIELKIEGKVE